MQGAPSVGKYAVDLPSFERLALPELAPQPGVQLYCVDEVGACFPSFVLECFFKAPVECGSSAWTQSVRLLGGCSAACALTCALPALQLHCVGNIGAPLLFVPELLLPRTPAGTSSPKRGRGGPTDKCSCAGGHHFLPLWAHHTMRRQLLALVPRR